MKRNYLSASIVVTVIGLAFIMFPQNIEMHIAPELVTVWEGTTTAEKSFSGSNYDFSFNPDPKDVGDGMSPYVSVWSNEMVTLNTTFTLGEEGVTVFVINITDNPSELLLPGDGAYDVVIEGNVLEETGAEVHAGIYFLRPMQPEYFTYYPFRFFGYGMAVIGALASLVFYLRGKDSTDTVVEVKS